jgi:hypothetical protein
VITLTAGQNITQNVALAAPASLSGVVVGTAVPAVPRVGWTVILYKATDYPTVQKAVTTTAAPDGSFSFPDIDAGNYIVEVRPTPGSVPVASQTATVLASDDVSITIRADGG